MLTSKWFIGFLGVCVLGVLSFFFARPIYRQFKDMRATQLANQALEGYLDSPADLAVIRQSAAKAQSALLLSPGNAWANRTLGTLALFDDPEVSLKYWNQAIQMMGSIEGFPERDRMHYVQTLILNRELDKAKSVLLSFSEDSPSYADVLYNLVKVCYLKGDRVQALEYARAMIRNRETPIGRHLLYANLCLNEEDKSIRQEGEKHIEFLLKNEELIDDSVLWQMTQASGLSDPLQSRLDQALNGRITGFEERIQLVDYRVENKQITSEEGLTQLMRALDRNDSLAVVRLAQWCSQHDHHEAVVDLMNVDLALKRKDWFLMYIKSLGVLGEWKRVLRVLTSEDCPLEPFLLDILECEAYAESGDRIKAVSQWYRAKIASNPVLNDLWLLVRIGDKIGLERETEKLFRELVIVGENPEKVLAYVAERELANEDYDAFYRHLTTFRELYNNVGSIVNDWAYYSFLMGRRVVEATEAVNQLVEQDPSQLRYHMTWALGQIKIGHYREVLARFQQFDLDWMELHPKWRFILALALAGVGEYEQADAYLEGVDPQTLRPMELELYEKHFYLRKQGS